MPTKLTIEHLSCYLPYGVKLLITKRGDFNRPDYTEISDWTTSDIMQPFNKRYQVRSCKPILRPLSDLTNEYVDLSPYFTRPKLIQAIQSKELPYSTFLHLVKGKFDLFSLIQSGLAISIHDVEGDVY